MLKSSLKAVVVVGLLLSAPTVAYAQAGCGGGTNGTPQTPSYLTGTEFRNGQAAGSITPDCMRDFVASVYSPTREYTIAPNGAPWGADYYCTATDCSAAFTSALTATKTAVAGATGGKIKLARGLYPFTTTVAVCDVAGVTIEGDSSGGLFGDGTVLSQNADVNLLDFCTTTNIPVQNQVRGITFRRGVSAATHGFIHSQYGAHSVISDNSFQTPDAITTSGPGIVLERAFDWQIKDNMFYRCGSDDTTGACIVLPPATGSQGGFATGYACSGMDISHNRFEPREGAVLYIPQPTNSQNACNDVRIIGNKMEGVSGTKAHIAISAVMDNSLITANKFTIFDGDAIQIKSPTPGTNGLTSQGDLIEANIFSTVAGSAVNALCYFCSITGNNFTFPPAGTTAYVVIATSSYGARVGNNTKSPSDTLKALLSDSGSSTVTTY